MTDDDEWPSLGVQPATSVTDGRIRSSYRAKEISDLVEYEHEWLLNTFGIDRHEPYYRIGWSFGLRPESRLYLRWFELADEGVKGWAVVFRIFDPVGEPTTNYELFVGWVPPARKADAERWVEFLNAEIRDRLEEAGKAPSAAEG